MDNFDAKERVKQATEIVDLIGGYVQLRREGRGYKAICPWHDDTRPSLQINPERQSFKCWVCQIGGDVFSFVMKMENVDFREALQLLADRANISLAPQPIAGGQRPPDSPDDKRVLLAAMAWAVDQYHRCLLEAPYAEPARNYLAERKITAESIKSFKLGFAPNEWDWMIKRAQNTSYSQAVLERIGLVIRRPNGPGCYDRFRGRVMFPIFDPQSRPVATGGRVLPEFATENQGKYINSPETPLFTKSKLLYGLNVAREPIHKANQALVMEGYTDVIVAHQFGFTNAVAVLGTALGSEHIKLLRRFAEGVQIVSVLDGDEAGRRRTNELLELFVAANADMRILTLPHDADPAEFLLEQGRESLQQLVEDCDDALKHAFNTATRGINLADDIQGATRALEYLLAIMAKAPRLQADSTIDHRLREEKFLQRLARDFRMSEEKLRERLIDLRRKAGSRSIERVDASSNFAAQTAAPFAEKLESGERDLLELLLIMPEFYERLAAAVDIRKLAHPLARTVFGKCRELAQNGVLPDFQRLLLEFDDPQVKNLLVELDEQARSRKAIETETWLNSVVAKFQHRELSRDVLRSNQQISDGSLTKEDELAVLLKIQQQHRARHGISAPTEG